MRDLNEASGHVFAALILFLSTAMTADAGGVPITVGADAGVCDFTDLQAAISDAADGDTIHLSGSAAHHRGNTYFIHTKTLTIRGGFDSCTANEPTGRTTLDADGEGRVFDIWLPTNQSEQDVHLENLVVINGQTVGTGGGIFIEGRQGQLFVSLENVEVRANETSGNGGGIGLLINANQDGSGAMLFMDDQSSIVDNAAELNGGGFSCRNTSDFSLGGTLVVIDRASIFGNQATNGGGMSVEGCHSRVQYVGGGSQFLLFTDAAIAANTALEFGGGVFVDGGNFQISGLRVGTTSVGFPVGDNNAGRLFANQAANGGGAYVTGEDSRLLLRDTVVDANNADFDGGGVFVSDGALVEVDRSNFGSNALSPCQPVETSANQTTIPRCSRLKDNTAGRNGGALYSDAGEFQVARAIISGNSAASNGSVVAVRGDSAEDTIGKALFDDSLVHDNTGTRLFYAWTNSDILVRWSTITGNNSPTDVFRAFTNNGVAQVRVAASIIWEDGGNLITTGGTGDLNAIGECVIGHQELGLVDATINFYHMADPLLFEADETRPYFPGPTSPAIDFCHGNQASGEPDLAGEDRGSAHTGSDLTNPPPWSGTGTFDIGAYETDWDELTDELFGDRFEG